MSEALQLAQDLFDLAQDKHRGGQTQDAASAYTRILSLDPSHAGCYHMLSMIARQVGQHDMAVGMLRKAIAFAPRDLMYRQDLRDLLRRLERKEEEADCLREICLLWPERGDSHLQLGIYLENQSRHAEALEHLNWAEHCFEAALDAAIETTAERASILDQLGLCLHTLKRWEEAESRLREALHLNPQSAAAHNGLGLVLIQLKRFAAAEACLREAIRLDPNSERHHINHGHVLRVLGRIAEAEACCHAALALQPNSAEAQYSLGMVRMLTGRLSQGWADLEKSVHWRTPRQIPGPRWHGEALQGRTLLLYSDQGFGDAVHFCRYVPEIARREHVALEVWGPLLRLMRSLDGPQTLVARGEMLPEYHAQCPLTSLGFVFDTTLESIPNTVPYLHAEPEAIAAWRRRLEPLSGLRVGVAWAGNPEFPEDRRRSTTLQELAPLAAVPGVELVSLQKHPRRDEATMRAATPPPSMILHDWTDELKDFAETAALITALDLVIAVDTAVVHLAGALGKPVWLLNRCDTDWRWMLHRDDSPWYPTLRQFRQPYPGDWETPIAAAQAALRTLAMSGRSSCSA